jgi:hypothetical protein
MAQASPSSRHAIQVRVPISLTAAIKAAADRELTTLSEYVRRVLIARLRSDGIDPAVEGPRGPADLRKRSEELRAQVETR